MRDVLRIILLMLSINLRHFLIVIIFTHPQIGSLLLHMWILLMSVLLHLEHLLLLPITINAQVVSLGQIHRIIGVQVYTLLVQPLVVWEWIFFVV